ncbi:MAG: hypothetical protein ACOC8N_04825 [Spirochaetota bacterium]
MEQQLKPKTETKTKTRQLQEVNQRIFLNLAQPTSQGESLRTELAGLLMERRHREYRWGLFGVGELLGTPTDIRDTSSVKVLKALSPDLYNEAGEAVKNLSSGSCSSPWRTPAPTIVSWNI